MPTEAEKRQSHINIEAKLDSLLDALSHHMSDEEQQIEDIRRDISKYFGELDAHVHTFHHNWVGEEIQDNELNNRWWSDVKKNIITGVIMLILGSTLTFIGISVWEHTVHQALTQHEIQEQGQPNVSSQSTNKNK